MRDRIPTKVLRNNAIRYAVYSEAGELQRYEYLLPADEPLDEGTPLNKGTLLSDGVAADMGLVDAAAVPDRAFNWIYQQFQSAFSAYDNTVTYTWSRSQRTVTETTGGFSVLLYSPVDGDSYDYTIYYADAYTTNIPDGTFTLTNAHKYTGSYTADVMTSRLRGKYFVVQGEDSLETTTSRAMYYMATNATVTIKFTREIEPADTATATFSNGRVYGFVDAGMTNVTSTSPNTYPNPRGWSGNIYYTLISTKGGGDPKLTSITAGQYTGTGSSGAANKTRITFSSSIPKVVIVASETSADTTILLRPCTSAAVLGRSGTLTVTWGDDYVEWYSDTAPNQLNNNGTVYHYAGII